MIPLFSADIDATSATRLSAGAVYMRPGHSALAHSHRKTDVIVLLLDSGPDGALTLFGDQLENEIWQQPFQALWIPRGVKHAAINPSASTSVIAVEFRSNPLLGDDNEREPALDWVVQARLQELHPQIPLHPFAGYRDADIARWSS